MKKYVSLLVGLTLAAYAADGTLDITFNPAGTPPGTFVTTNQFGGEPSIANAVVVRHDGLIVLGGSVASNVGTDFAILILNPDGTVNATASNHVGGAGSLDQITGLAIQPDLAVVASGISRVNEGEFFHSQFVVARYCPSGDIDTSFGTNGVTIVDFTPVSQNPTGPPVSAEAYAVAFMRDGRIVVVGRAQEDGDALSNPYFYAVAVLNQNGTLDSSFAAGAGRRIYGPLAIPINSASIAKAVAIQSMGSADNIIIAGEGTTPLIAGIQQFQVVRILPNGDLDLTFATNGVAAGLFNGLQAIANGVDIYPDGRIVAAGTVVGLTNTDIGVVRLQPNGAHDLSFNGSGELIIAISDTNLSGNALVIQDDLKILIAGSALNTLSGIQEFITFRVNEDGSPDLTFNGTGSNEQAFVNPSAAHAIALQNDGKIMVVGSSDTTGTSEMAALRYLNNNTGFVVFLPPSIFLPSFLNCSNPPTLSGFAQNPSNITVYIDGVEAGRTITTDAANEWTFTPASPLQPGPHSYQIVAEYKSGNMNAISPFACCGVGLGPQSCISIAIRQKYCSLCPATPFPLACSVVA